MKKILFNTFALIGFGTFIFLACSVAEPDPTEPTDPTQTTNTTCEVEVEVDAALLNEYGKYQISAMTGGSSNNNEFIIALNTETGVIRSYELYQDGWTQTSWGDLTLTH